MMADAYARVSGRLGVVTVHQGCGLTNAMTGITEAAKSRTPLVVLAADTGAAAVRSNFRIDQDALATAVGAVAERVHSAGSAVADTVRAVRTAVEQRRTVVLNLPLDVQAQPVPELPALAPVVPLPAPRAAAAAVAELAAILAGPSGRCSSPAAARGRPARGCRAGRAVRRAAGHLGGGQGPVRRRPVVAGRLRRVRHPARRRADRRRRRGRRLGLRR